LIDVVSVHTHPEYESYDLDFDFAVMKLAKVAEFPKNVNFIKLPNENDKIVDGEETFVSGWGATLNNNEDSEYLRAVEVPLISLERCRKSFEYAFTLTDRMLCAGFPEGKKDSCKGDSGGPMKRIKDNVLIGLVSWGHKCAFPNKPGVYSRVSYVRAWIKKITDL
jgi:trypsin